MVVLSVPSTARLGPLPFHLDALPSSPPPVPLPDSPDDDHEPGSGGVGDQDQGLRNSTSSKKKTAKPSYVWKMFPLPRRRPILCARYRTEVSTTTPPVDL